VLEGLDTSVKRIVVSEIIDNTYYAVIYIDKSGEEIQIDSRPSDAIAVAIRMNSPIFVEKHVIESRNNDELEEWLRNLKPEDFENVM
jgi:bifunctional DNase/RNase